MAIALLLGTPFFVFFGWLSDKIGRKPIILAGCLLAALTYFPLFKALTAAANPRSGGGRRQRAGDRGRRSGRLLFQFDPVGKTAFNHSCDLAKSLPGQRRRHLRQPARRRPARWPRSASAIRR